MEPLNLEEYSRDELILIAKDFYNSIEQITEAHKEQYELLKRLSHENEEINDIIVKNNLGQLSKDYRDIKYKAEYLENQIGTMEKDYQNKISELNLLANNINEKGQDINAYVDLKINEVTDKYKEKEEKIKKKYEKKIDCTIEQYKSDCKKQINKYRVILSVSIAINIIFAVIIYFIIK